MIEYSNQSSLLADMAIERLSRLSIFSEKDYLELHRDVAMSGVNALWHAVHRGQIEGRQLFKRSTLGRVLGRFPDQEDQVAPAKPSYSPAFTGRSGSSSNVETVAVYVSTLGNAFMREIALDLARDLQRGGVEVQVLNEKSEVRLHTSSSIFVAPHEFFALGLGQKWIRDDIISNALVYNTEQLQTSWFAKAMPIIMAARGVLDISPQVASIFQAAEIPCLHFEPGTDLERQWLRPSDLAHPLMRTLPPGARQIGSNSNEWRTRPIDVSFFGSESPRRETMFANYAAFLAEHSTFIYYRRRGGPILVDSEEEALTRIAGHVSAHSKISLNIHRDEFPYFEWHRMVRQAMASGSLVVTDPCLPHPHLKPGVHFFQEDPRQIPNLLHWLLNDTEGQVKAEEVVNNALRMLSDDVRCIERSQSILEFISSTQ